MYAIIETGSKQYKVTNGSKIKVEKLEANVGDSIVFDKVLLVSDEEITVGKPYIDGKTINGTVLSQSKSKKVVVYKYKRKSGYHKKNGHRQPYTEVKIEM